MDTPTETEATPKPKITRYAVAKTVAGVLVGSSVNSVVKTMIHQNITPKNKLQNVQLLIAAWSLGGMAAKAATDATHERLDGYADRLTKVQARVAEIQKSKNENVTE